jgi:hypothetical protein
MAVLASDLVEATRAHLDSGSRPELNRLNGAITSSATTLVIEFAAGSIVTGAVLAIELEHMYVWSISGSTVTVERGWNGTTKATHADDVLIYVNPRWSAFTILRAINAELASYSSPRWGLFQMKTVDLTYSAATVGYDLTSVTDLIDVYELRWKGYTTGDWPLIRRWSLARNMATTEFASGLALLLDEGAGPGKTIRVRYKAPFAELTALSSDVQTVAGLPASANDIPPLGAAARLVAPREVKRAFTDSQPESRTAAEVPPGANRSAAGTLLQIRDARLHEEAARLNQRYPTLAKVS